MTVYERIKEIVKKYNILVDEDPDENKLIRKICYGDFYYETGNRIKSKYGSYPETIVPEEVELVEENRENSSYYWIIRIDDKFYKVSGSYDSHYGTEIYDNAPIQVEKKPATRKKWVEV